MKINDEVMATIGGFTMNAVVRWPKNGDGMIELTLTDGTRVATQADRVVPVVPPCPWTRIGTLVMTRPVGHVFRLETDGWWSHTAQITVDYADSIAPYDPRELVPVETVVPLSGQYGWAWIDASISESHIIHAVYGNKGSIEALKDRLNVVTT